MISFCIYVLAGREIFAKRKQLRAFRNPSRPVPGQIGSSLTSFKTTEIHITTELTAAHSSTPIGAFLGPDEQRAGINDKNYDQYSVTIGSAPMSSRSEVPRPIESRAQSTTVQQNNRRAMEANRAAFGYTKVALLFFVSLLVTWVSFLTHTTPSNQARVKHPRTHENPQVPSSTNRVFSLVHPSLIYPPFTYASAVVLPLMGFWNSVIYITTSWAAVRLLFSGKLNAEKGSSMSYSSKPSLGARKLTGTESDSMKGLAVGRRSGYDQV